MGFAAFEVSKIHSKNLHCGVILKNDLHGRKKYAIFIFLARFAGAHRRRKINITYFLLFFLKGNFKKF